MFERMLTLGSAAALTFGLSAGLVASLTAQDGSAAKPGGDQPNAKPLDEQVVQASREWFDALAKGDFDAVDRLEADDFMTIQRAPQGVAVVGKKDQMAMLRKSRRAALERELKNIRVRGYGTTAILTAVATFKGQAPNGNPLMSQSVITEVWILAAGRWRLAHFQAVDVPPAPKK